jgi:hypothetical protein
LERCGAGRPLTAAETADCLEPLETAHGLGAADAEVYGLMATIWLKSAELPARADLMSLMEGIKEYPADGDLAYGTTLVFLRAGAVPTAKAIIRHELASGDAGTRMRFATLQVQTSN